MRWRVSHRTVGYGPLYQGRFKSFPVQQDETHFLNVCRYVERNALTAGLVKHAEHWRWSSLWAREHGTEELKAVLSPWPVRRRANWAQFVNDPITQTEMQRLDVCVDRGQPFGNENWTRRMVNRLHLQHTSRREGRPRFSN